MERENLADARVVAQQLGRKPRGAFTVCVRCTYGYPQVIRVHPVVAGKPFPTLYWLTCPFLSREIGRLEADGHVKTLEALLQMDPALRSAMHEAHRRTCGLRDQLLSSQDRAKLSSDGKMLGLAGRGIGGISDWDRLKCLHLHAAHALADENPIGQRVLAMLPVRECPARKVICSAYE